MADEPENLTIRLLQEMRESMARLDARMELLSARFDEGLLDLTQRVDGNTLLLNLVAGVAHNHEERIGNLEGGRGQG